jgi:hypothetical protein
MTTDLDLAQRARLRAALSPVEHPGLPDPPADTAGMHLKRVADVEATPGAGEFVARVFRFRDRSRLRAIRPAQL